MLINKWLLTDHLAAVAGTSATTGICIILQNSISNRPGFFERIQKNLATPFTILLDVDGLNDPAAAGALIEDIISLFFQPAYYTENDAPVVFVNSTGAATAPFRTALLQKSLGQGIRSVLFKEVWPEGLATAPEKSFNFLLKNSAIAFDVVLQHWIDECTDKKQAPEIHLLVPVANAKEIIDGLDQQEALVKDTRQFKLALFLYEQQRLIADYRLQLEIQTTEAKNTRLYLSIQKEERANALKWYEKEYEVLPLWYKQFGHIIKVLTGKRTFRSLFKDDVKKLKL